MEHRGGGHVIICRVKGLRLLLPLIVLVLFGCGNATDKQWYKPNVDYTAAEFERDRVACSPKKNNILDEACMKARGWLPLSGDIGSSVKAPEMQKRGGKY
jgi:hypothetical protein